MNALDRDSADARKARLSRVEYDLFVDAVVLIES